MSRSLILLPLLLGVLYMPRVQAVPVCVEDRAGIAPAARGAFEKELITLLGHEQLHLIWAGCESQPAADAISLSFLEYGPHNDSAVLGVAHRRGDRIKPRIELYLKPILSGRLSDWSTVGRALARIAAHEVGHWLQQSGEHSRWGLMREAFSMSALHGEDSHPFRLLR